VTVVRSFLAFGTAALALLAAVPPACAERWKLQYFYDENKSSLAIADIKFASARRGVAVGVISEGKQLRPTSLVTSDGGEHWTLVPTKEAGVSLFLLDESLAWMVTAKGIWRSTEGGRNWSKLPESPKGALRVWFLDQNHGFAVGMKKGAYETKDGGRKWTAIPAAAKPTSKVENSAYTWIGFAPDGRNGMIAGWSMPPRKGEPSLPVWIEPDAALRRTEQPHLGFILQTADGGATWNSSATSMMGRITRIRFAPSVNALWLVEFGESFAYASEVYRADGRQNKLERVYRSRDRAITDAWVTPKGVGYLAGVELLGQLRGAFVPGKLKMLRSPDLTNWTEMPVDYRATATRAVLSAVDDGNIWVATDTGMILKLEP
jgi:photosystem II stability/assembly factor-like uncharacterized protein